MNGAPTERLARVRAGVLGLGPTDSRGGLASAALAKLHIERAERIALGEYHAMDLAAETETANAERALEWARKGTAPYAGTAGENLTLAYEAENDHSVQPYFVYVPRGYDRTQRYPLIIYLHGWVPETSKLAPWLVQDSVLRMCDQRGVLFLQPHGRGNTDFQGVGEVDVLRAIDETCSLYSVDPARVYIGGNSMGGYGAYCIAMHHPDLFAGLAVGCGQSDYFVWYGLDRPSVPAFKRTMLSLSNPVDWFENALHIPTLIQHGEDDPLVPVEHSRIAADALARLGYAHSLRIVPREGHTIYFEDDYYERLMSFLLPLRRPEAPAEIRFTTYSLDYSRAYWLRVDRISRWGARADVRARAERGHVSVTAENVAALSLHLDRDLVGAGPVAVTVNGEERWRGEPPEDRTVPIALEAAREGTRSKCPGLCGPIRAVFEQPFVCVYGGEAVAPTAPENEPRSDAYSLFLRFTREWWSFAEGLPWVFPDPGGPWPECWAVPHAGVGDGVASTRNLVLFGRPEENSYLASIAAALPVTFIPNGYRIGGVDYTDGNLGLWFCYPNPRAPSHLILSISGYPWGVGFRSVTRADHKLDLLPDLILYGDTTDTDDTNRYRAAGFFDADWRLGSLDTAPPVPRG